MLKPWFHLDRPIIRESKQLRVSVDDFDIKQQIGSGYFGEVNVSFCIHYFCPHFVIQIIAAGDG